MISEMNQKRLVLSAVVFVIGMLLLGFLSLRKLERLVMVAERTEQKVDRMIEAMAPLGKATVEKGAAMIESVDHEDMAKSAEKNIKEVGTAAKQHMMDYMERKAAEEAATTPNPTPEE